MTKKILITGVHGFLGEAMQHFLQTQTKGHEIYGLSRRKNTSICGLVCDLNDSKRLKKILADLRPQIIFHFAGGRLGDNQKTFDANFATTRQLLETIQVIPNFKPRVIIPGSAAEYGNIVGRKLISELSLPKPLGWYGFVKLLQTELGLYYARQGLDVVVVRMFNICGAHTPANLAIGGFVRQIVAIEGGATPIIHTKNLDGQRDFLDVEDVCRGLWLAALKAKVGEVYNLCSGRPSTIRDLLQQLLSLSKCKNIVLKENKEDASLSFDVIGSNSKFRAATQWSARISLKRSLKNTLDSYRR